MTYREKFEASQNRAHHQNIATKILRDMTDLRSKADDSPLVPRRWIWELIQNAKDVHLDGGVRIRIDFLQTGKNPSVAFRHTGKPFSADNIRFLIEQISTKDRGKDEGGKRKNTGKFGTGFLTTHLLSEKVTVKAVAKEPGLDYRKFTLELDRSGFDVNEITEAVKKAKDSVSNLDLLPPYTEYKATNYNTSFIYPLNDDVGINTATLGLEDLERCLFYVLTFVEEIACVEVIHKDRIYFNAQTKATEGKNISIVTIKTEDIDQILGPTEFNFIKLTGGLTSIVAPIEISDGIVSFVPIDNKIPRLFCDFPLIGTEVFPFPVVVNNPNFNPTDPRDGVYLTNPTRTIPEIDENKEIIKNAIELYFQLLDYAVKNNWRNLHLLAQINTISECPTWLSENWFNTEVLKPIRKKLLHTKIVTTAYKNQLASILQDDNSKYVWFPYSNKKEIREKIWGLAKDWFPHVLPKQNEVDIWYRLYWNECGKLTLDQFADFVEQRKTLDSLFEALKKEKAVLDWLNEFYALLKLDEKESNTILENRAIIPDQNGNFWKKSQLQKDAGDIPDIFKDILKNLGKDIRAELADKEIEIDFGEKRIVNQASIVREIISEVSEKTNDRDVAKHYRVAFKQLLDYFRKNPENASALFPTLIRMKHVLYDDDEIQENISKAEQLDDILEEFEVTSAGELRALLENHPRHENSLLPVTQEILLSLGITSIAEWTKALEDKDFKLLFSHESLPTRDMFVYVQTLIAKAKKRVIAHLQGLIEYDLSEMDDQTATTVLAGVLKNGNPISIVFRPAYDSQVIIYYGSELDILDYEHSELWVDDGQEVKQISLGRILKTTGIRKFPI